MKTIATSALLALAAISAVAVATTADARPRKRQAYGADVIVVRPRAFTDSGVVVPVGSREGYVMQSTYFNMQPYERYSPGILWRPDPGMR
ncbi:MAG TPA: hypothetical protein PKA55_18015 [Rhodoblastus sp.]|nr:hypothetical protein [Rhodoblastus sp.]